MIEIIYNETKKGIGENDEIFDIPNNIRQIGESREHLKIYMEDYAYTFLKRMSKQDTESGCAAILLGEAKWKDSVSYLFVRSALKIEEPDISAEYMPFSDAAWGNIHKDIEKYFPDQEVIGWTLSLPGFNMKINDIILRAHLNHFAGNQKVLFVMEPSEKEEAFFLYENNQMAKQSGYYIYYEKNEPMQSYMIEKGGNNSIEETERASDKAVIDFRKIVSGKKEKESRQQGLSKRLLYGVSACSLVALLAFGITFFQDYRTMEDTVSKISGENNREVTSDNVENEVIQEVSGSKTTRETPTEDQKQKAETPGTEEDSTGGNDQEDSEAQASSEDGANAGNSTTPMPSATAAPTGTASPEPAEPQIPNTNAQSTAGIENVVVPYQRYVVKRGDTLTQISEDYYGTIGKLDEICEVNNISPEDIIYAGQVIVLP